DLNDVVENLNQLSNWDWDRYIQRCIYQPNSKVTSDGLVRAGYQLEWNALKSKYQQRYEEYVGKVDATGSIGVAVSETGGIRRVIPGSVADKAGVQTSSEIVAVNRRKFTIRELEKALEDSPSQKKIALIVQDGDWFDVLELPYEQGPKYPVLHQVAEKDDVLRSILTPHSPPEVSASEQSSDVTTDAGG
ncbi:MAG: hypothetical protein KDA61_22205, partial [Planctomycetales bacterium]|nr:hypothetical protein [Planctomycetales bacterium]